MESSADDREDLQASQTSNASFSSTSSISWPLGRPPSNGSVNTRSAQGTESATPADSRDFISPFTHASNGGAPVSGLANRGHSSASNSLPGSGAATPSSYPVRFGPYLHRDNLPGEPKSLSGIATRAFCLGISLGFSTLLTLILARQGSPLWRAPFFLLTLSLFHFLEFWTTARYNTPQANVSAFLLSSNGTAYNVAHTAALVECLVHYLIFSSESGSRSGSFSASSFISLSTILLVMGFSMIIVGQVARSVAMVHAGTNFNHTVQTRRNAGHELVTSGIYAHLRHPSYFGFFWWGLGTQLVLGNVICLVGYAVVLWRFFSRRIDREEELLVSFFGREYLDYHERTRVGIPFVR
ncbi:ICMT-domain-containing protein [Xylona heveae TC161]|uniref:Protein-S-isoprenylcysteine O-methyltransferase n=1 Tax=Xylona heveae (strain CBS 132557 / TC161) TaxID=1328760 RepID=A0A165G0A1_XYLHT|nr:ICMT-domain-containing protein [Xylona heveae TC161]KZF21589.1 ICMT-domain-containing protein [Xylona heveae TC161]